MSRGTSRARINALRYLSFSFHFPTHKLKTLGSEELLKATLGRHCCFLGAHWPGGSQLRGQERDGGEAPAHQASAS